MAKNYERFKKFIQTESKKLKWNICITYKGVHYPEWDAVIRDLLKLDDIGSGMGFGERDLTFEFETKEKALAAKRKLKAKFKKDLWCDVERADVPFLPLL